MFLLRFGQQPRVEANGPNILPERESLFVRWRPKDVQARAPIGIEQHDEAVHLRGRLRVLPDETLMAEGFRREGNCDGHDAEHDFLAGHAWVQAPMNRLTIGRAASAGRSASAW